MQRSRPDPETNIAERLGLTPQEFSIILDLLSRHVPDRPVWAFGSRTFGRARRRSDLDLAIGGPTSLARGVLFELEEALDESDLPIEVDLVDLHQITKEFRERIEPDFVGLTPLAPTPSTAGASQAYA